MSSPSRSDLYAPILTRPNVTPVSKTLNTVLISVAATPHATYAFHWALKHFLKPSDIATQKVIFILYKIVLFTVQTVTRTASSYVGNYIGGNSGVGNSNTLDKAEQKLYNAACLLLRGYRKEILSKFPDANIEMVVSHGQPAEDIVEYAEKHKVDTVILGSRSLSKLKKVLLGSVGDYCTHHLKCPVMIIKTPGLK